jgi:protein gp37
MAENSSIEWTDHTFNPWEGCQKVSPGCDHCYAETRNARFGGGIAINWGPGAPRRRTSPSNWRKPIAWNRAHAEFFAARGRRQRVFCASLADVFDNAVDLLWRRDLFRLIADTPNLDWLLLTKRIGNVPTMLRHIGVERLPGNVWLGATIVNQEEADRDIPKLLAVPARVRFLSMEPLLGPVDLSRWLDPNGTCCMRESPCEGCPAHAAPHRQLDWVIVGGESGHGARPMHPDWARSLRDQCAAAGVAFNLKQWGEWHTAAYTMSTGEPTFQQFATFDQWVNKASTWINGGICLDSDGRQLQIGADFMRARDEGKFPVTIMHRVGKKAAGRQLDGRTHDEFPEAR